jgi:membrane-associated phospholipid phosphatase
MRFTFAHGFACHDLSSANTLQIPSEISAPEADRDAALAARNVAAKYIADTLWPVFDRRNPTSPLSKRAEALLKADFAILKDMQLEVDTSWGAEDYVAYYCDDSMFESIGIKPRGGSLTHHRTHFAASFGRFVGSAFSDADLDKLDAVFLQEVSGTPNAQLISWIVMSLKHMFQRPRPHQFAFDNNDVTFKHMLSQLAHSPSLPSGHAFDAAFAAILGAELIAQHETWMSHKELLPAWAAAFGDRRNYAGLHYPSDNWASWLTVATVIHTLFQSDIAQRSKESLRKNIKASRCFAKAKDLDEFAQAKNQLVLLLGALD